MAQHSQVSAKQVATAISNIIDLTQRPRALKIASYRRVTDAVVTLGGIDREEFFAFAEGQIDRFGNPINLSFLNQQRASLNSLPLSHDAVKSVLTIPRNTHPNSTPRYRKPSRT